MRVAFQGEPGAYSEAAALEHFGAETVTLPCETFDAVFAAVESGRVRRRPRADRKLARRAASTATMTCCSSTRCRSWASITCACSTASSRIPASRLGDIRKVISHPQALAQCEGYMRSLPGVKAEARLRYRRERQDRSASRATAPTAAIASRRAAEVYGMAILAEGIEDDPANFTRFLAIARQAADRPAARRPGGDAKTSIVFTLNNVPGSLFKALSVFALRDLDLTKIESRPLVGKPWEYFFYIDFAGSTADPAVSRALDHLGEYALMLRVLGSYPRHRP